jgi:S-adenosylmethionine:tRNA ribosyltransferase-isomerase
VSRASDRASGRFPAADYAYELPPELIAQAPAEPRDASRLLVLDRASGALTHARFREVGRWLRPGDLLVANRSRVVPARLRARRAAGGGGVELLLLRRIEPGLWEALVRPGRKLPPGETVALDGGVRGEIVERTAAGGRLVRFSPSAALGSARTRGAEAGGAPASGEGTANPRPAEAAPDSRAGHAAIVHGGLGAARDAHDPDDIDAAVLALGSLPLPPYIRGYAGDPERYQTVYGDALGSAAAPTAGLHFTPALLEELRGRGVGFATVTLHVGLDTFRPVRAADLADHEIHAEWCTVPEETARAVNEARMRGGRVVAVGTTTVRALETAAAARPDAPLDAWTGETRLYILPGYQFRAVDALVTNFHLPGSTLLALVSAFAGRERIMAAYREAIRERYRFFSFGDAMLLL